MEAMGLDHSRWVAHNGGKRLDIGGGFYFQTDADYDFLYFGWADNSGTMSIWMEHGKGDHVAVADRVWKSLCTAVGATRATNHVNVCLENIAESLAAIANAVQSNRYSHNPSNG